MTTIGNLGLTAHQVANARGILAAVKARGWTSKAAVIAVETALTESGMRILASANVPESLRYPHDLLSWSVDGLGHDHASMGMFQQQTGYKWCPNGVGSALNQTTMTSPNGWGTPGELMNAEKSTAKFLNSLARVDWAHMTNWAAAQAVQHSAFDDGSNYRGQDARANAIVDALWATATTEGDEVATIYKDKGLPNGKRDLAVLVDGSARIVLTNSQDTQALIDNGAKVVSVSHETHTRLRKGAVK